MVEELRAANPESPIQFVAVNEFGHEAGNPLSVDGKTTPILQDVDADGNGQSDVWRDLWGVTYRDVKILNSENELVGTVNLTPPDGYDLSETDNYNALKQILDDVAHQRPFWQNQSEPTDVNDDQRVSALDALLCINELMLNRVSDENYRLPLPMPPIQPTPYVDVNGDGYITAVDALRVINRIVADSPSGEGELLGRHKENVDDLMELDAIPTPPFLVVTPLLKVVSLDERSVETGLSFADDEKSYEISVRAIQRDDSDGDQAIEWSLRDSAQDSFHDHISSLSKMDHLRAVDRFFESCELRRNLVSNLKHSSAS
ncbi:dockerin type I domain-containing protein [Rhodopirellula sp.]|nr:dockerin type I domain-containing protein [Rhodopirellula sp.]MDB4678925.1 dockerin type I domain-containing protein [Rhodopirellula sp.]